MSGVIDKSGQQWEHCNVCGDLTRIEELRYVQPSTSWPYGFDVCPRCHDKISVLTMRALIKVDGTPIVPAYTYGTIIDVEEDDILLIDFGKYGEQRVHKDEIELATRYRK